MNGGLSELEELLREMHRWMASYMKSFYTDDEEVQHGILIKETHTGYVTANAVALAGHLGLCEHDIRLAEITGLFHDVGRFHQYTLYRTFVDAQSEDHAELGVKLLEELDFMKKLPAEDWELVRFAIRNHNKRAIEPIDDPKTLLFAKLIRDADKLDIYRVLLPYLTDKNPDRQPNWVKAKSDPAISPDFIKRFVAGEQVDYNMIRTYGDRKLVRLMWVYDVNFSWTLRRIRDEGYVDLIISSLPMDEQVEKGIARLLAHVETKCAEDDSEALARIGWTGTAKQEE